MMHRMADQSRRGGGAGEKKRKGKTPKHEVLRNSTAYSFWHRLCIIQKQVPVSNRKEEGKEKPLVPWDSAITAPHYFYVLRYKRMPYI